jgi:hypothetical protein
MGIQGEAQDHGQVMNHDRTNIRTSRLSISQCMSGGWTWRTPAKVNEEIKCSAIALTDCAMVAYTWSIGKATTLKVLLASKMEDLWNNHSTCITAVFVQKLCNLYYLFLGTTKVCMIWVCLLFNHLLYSTKWIRFVKFLFSMNYKNTQAEVPVCNNRTIDWKH